MNWEFHERGFSQAVRMDDWKAVRLQSRNRPVELYDLKNDPGEQRDVAAAHPDIARRMAHIMKTARTDSPLFPVRDAQ
jgi:arylsulfatase A-like enzyme